MRIHWTNIFGLLEQGLAIYLAISLMPFLHRWCVFLQDEYRFESHGPAIAIGALGLLCVTIVAVTKIIAQRPR